MNACPVRESLITHRTRVPAIFAILLSMLLAPHATVSAYQLNGFVIDDPTIPADEIMRGGPPRDGIPALDTPQFLTATQADYLHPDDRVLGLSWGGVQRAYPIRILNYHEIVNDRIGEQPVLVSFCPLCGTGMVFQVPADWPDPEFGVSGLLYNSDLLMYDRQTESLWSQIEGTAVSGKRKGVELGRLPVAHTTWEAWQAKYPQTQVLDINTGFRRDYGSTPYPGYENSDLVYFPVNHVDRRYPPKELTLGVSVGDHHKAYPFSELQALEGTMQDRLGGQKIMIRFDKRSQWAQAFNSDGEELPGLVAFWFAWAAFHPDTEVFQAP